MQLSLFDRSDLNIKSISEMEHGLDISIINMPRNSADRGLITQFSTIANSIIKAKKIIAP